MTTYAAHLARKCQEWREKYPLRAEQLHGYVMRQLGIKPTNDSRIAADAIALQEQEIVRITQGWPLEDDWHGEEKHQWPAPLPPQEKAS